VAIAAALAGAAVVRAMFGSALARFEKSGGDFATTADLEAEKAIIGVIRAARPADAVTGEESGCGDAGTAERRWLVDPLCGTLNYAARSMLAAVNVALQAASGITVAASADPFSGEVFWTDGNRACVRGDGADIALAPTPCTQLVDVNLDPPFPNAPGFRAVSLLADEAFTARFRPRVVSSTLALAWVAAGRRAAYVTDGHLSDSVHFAAGIALCQAAGCTVTGIHGQPLHTGTGGLIAACDRQTHAALLDMIGDQAPPHRLASSDAPAGLRAGVRQPGMATLACVTEAWDPGAAGVLRLPSGRLVRGRALRRPAPARPAPQFALYLLAREPPPAPWETCWVRWPDFRLPSDPAAAAGALHEAWERAAAERIEIACAGGLGRTGTALACLVVLDGLPGRQAIAYVRRHYDPRSVETPGQRRFVVDFGETRSGLPDGGSGLSGVADRVLGFGDDLGLA